MTAAKAEWDKVVKLGHTNGFRNAQASVLAPTGTIGFMMDCDTTGIEPDFSLVKFKKMVGGGSMQIVNQTVPRALKNLGYTPEQAEKIVATSPTTVRSLVLLVLMRPTTRFSIAPWAPGSSPRWVTYG
ncbi:ribonucleotide reductase [Cutibacterium acnes JCM 18909]|nr:ribonucleotide reductase [Cutibacterium acnes JCM 18909]